MRCRQVQAGVGRTGKWWGHQHVLHGEPDIMCFAKGIASGFPFAGAAQPRSSCAATACFCRAVNSMHAGGGDI